MACSLKNNLAAGFITLTRPVGYIKSVYKHNTGNSWHSRKSCLTFSFDCDYPRDVEALPYLLNLLAKYSFKASFACVGHWIEQYPQEHKLILQHGHEIVNHTYSHPDNELLNPGRKFRNIPREEKLSEIQRCHTVCKDILGYAPTGCRIPHFKNLFTPEIYGILKDLNYVYSSSTLLTNTGSFGKPFIAQEGIIEIPLSTCPRHPFTVFDTWHSFNSPRMFYRLVHRTETQYNELFKLLIEIGMETNSYINIYIDPADILKMPNFAQVLDYVKEREKDIWVTSYEDLIRKVYNA
jgi:peptidoglycan-N-acetylglucosamine deacetylase